MCVCVWNVFNRISCNEIWTHILTFIIPNFGIETVTKQPLLCLKSNTMVNKNYMLFGFYKILHVDLFCLTPPSHTHTPRQTTTHQFKGIDRLTERQTDRHTRSCAHAHTTVSAYARDTVFYSLSNSMIIQRKRAQWSTFCLKIIRFLASAPSGNAYKRTKIKVADRSLFCSDDFLFGNNQNIFSIHVVQNMPLKKTQTVQPTRSQRKIKDKYVYVGKKKDS